MMEKLIGRLVRVDLRDIWLNEASDFTPWLARPENLAILAETIGLDLELEAQEQRVGPFRADILCKDPDTDNWVLIENQLARTDHIHLGQLLTYAAGLQAVTIAWIAASFYVTGTHSMSISPPTISRSGRERRVRSIGRPTASGALDFTWLQR